MKLHLMLKAALFISFCILANSCKKDPAYMSDGIINGWDQRACVCCGGLMISFTGETAPYKGDFKLIYNSSDLDIKANDTFPIYVKLDWTADANICMGNYITVHRLKRK
ncbi:MAG: hypothetical protein ACXVBZ_11995 [Flavisolibacter sp.]